jgi:hypothetical protein
MCQPAASGHRNPLPKRRGGGRNVCMRSVYWVPVSEDGIGGVKARPPREGSPIKYFMPSGT